MAHFKRSELQCFVNQRDKSPPPVFAGRQLVLSDVFTIAAETRHKRIGLEAGFPALEGGELSRSLCIVQYKRAAQWPPPCDGSGLPAVRTRRGLAGPLLIAVARERRPASGSRLGTTQAWACSR